MAPRLDKARGLERRTMAYQVRQPTVTNIQVNKAFKRLAPPAHQQFKKIARPALLPGTPPTSTMPSLLSNATPKYVYARECLCCPTGITIATRDGIALKLVFQPGCEKCEACTCIPLEVADDQPDPWRLFWQLNKACGYCHAGAPVVKNVVKEKKSFDKKIWEAFALSDGGDGGIDSAGVEEQGADAGGAADLNKPGDLENATDLSNALDLNNATNLNETTGLVKATNLGEVANVAEQTEGDPFAAYFTSAGVAVPKNTESDWEDTVVYGAAGSVEEDSGGLVAVEPVAIEGQVKPMDHGKQGGGVQFIWKGFGGCHLKLRDWRNLFIRKF